MSNVMPNKDSASPVIRAAEFPRDWLDIRRLFVELQEHGRSSDARLPAGEEISESYLSEKMRACEEHQGKIFVAELNGEVSGYVCVLAKCPCRELADGLAEQAEVVDLVVSKDFRSSGIGKALLEVAEDYVASVGVGWLRVSVFAENKSACNFYNASGFSLHEVTYEKRIHTG